MIKSKITIKTLIWDKTPDPRRETHSVNSGLYSPTFTLSKWFNETAETIAAEKAFASTLFLGKPSACTHTS